MVAMPYPKPDTDVPAAHFARLLDELGYLAANAGRLKGVQAGTAVEVASAANDLAQWVTDRLAQGVALR